MPDSAALSAAEVFLLWASALLLAALILAMGIHDANTQLRFLHSLGIGEHCYSPQAFTAVVMSVSAVIAAHPSFFPQFAANCQEEITHWTVTAALRAKGAVDRQCRADAQAMLFQVDACVARKFVPLIVCFIGTARIALFALLTDFLHAIRIFHVRFVMRLMSRPRIATC